MLVTDGGQLIRCPVHDVRIAGRNTQGVRVFKTDGAEKVVSVERISEEVAGDGNGDAGGEAADEAAAVRGSADAGDDENRRRASAPA